MRPRNPSTLLPSLLFLSSLFHSHGSIPAWRSHNVPIPALPLATFAPLILAALTIASTTATPGSATSSFAASSSKSANGVASSTADMIEAAFSWTDFDPRDVAGQSADLTSRRSAVSNPCSPNPCKAANTVCVVSAGKAVCNCKAGFVKKGSSCVQSSPPPRPPPRRPPPPKKNPPLRSPPPNSSKKPPPSRFPPPSTTKKPPPLLSPPPSAKKSPPPRASPPPRKQSPPPPLVPTKLSSPPPPVPTKLSSPPPPVPTKLSSPPPPVPTKLSSPPPPVQEKFSPPPSPLPSPTAMSPPPMALPPPTPSSSPPPSAAGLCKRAASFCGANTECVDNGNSSVTCNCLPGFSRDNSGECYANDDKCLHYCDQLPNSVCKTDGGKQLCYCDSHSFLSVSRCRDVCEGSCDNSSLCRSLGAGDFECYCPAGFSKMDDGKCVDVCLDKCDDSAVCNAVDGTLNFTCECPDNLSMQPDGSCKDPCIVSNFCGPDSTCTTYANKAHCRCREGFVNITSIGHCVDPCVGVKCPSTAKCVAPESAPLCICPEGQHFVGQVCTGMASRALAWAQHLVNDNCGFYHGDTAGVGQNLFMGSADQPNKTDAIYDFVNEFPFWTYGKIGESDACAPNQQCLHYTQVMWQSTVSVGCGIAFCAPADGFTRHIIACDYSPPGNFRGQAPFPE